MADPRDVDALNRQIRGLEIEVSKNENGGFTVCSSSEPFFCYDATSVNDAQKLVARTLTSYAKNFFHVENLEFPIEETALGSASVAIERGTPVARLKLAA